MESPTYSSPEMRLMYMKLRLLITFIIIFLAASLNAGQCPPLYTFTGSAMNDYLGYSVASAGDVNNDGYEDIIIGAYLKNSTDFEAGEAYVFDGKTGDTLFVFSGEGFRDHFGFSVSSAGDVNNDGFDDVIIGADWSSYTYDYAGRAYVFSGKDGDTLYVFDGHASAIGLGYSVASAGDLDGDNFDDIIISAPFEGNTLGNPGGSVYVISGKSGDTLYNWSGDQTYSTFGFSVAANGDVNNDGTNDIIIGAPRQFSTEPIAGRVYVFSGATGDTLYVFDGEIKEHKFGSSVSFAGDVNNDGYDDIIIGSDKTNYFDTTESQVYVFSGKSGDTLYLFDGDGVFGNFGRYVSTAGDLDNDGFDDFAIGARFSYVDSILGVGKLYVFSGQTGDTLILLSGKENGDFFGCSVAPLADNDGDGHSNLIIGAYGRNEPVHDAGQAYIFSCCCFGGRGDLNGDNSNSNILDLTFIIDLIFRGGVQATCPGEADINSDGTPSNILDLTYIVDFIFRGGSAPPKCWE